MIPTAPLRSARRASIACSAIVLTGATVALTGWALAIPTLRREGWGNEPVRPNTAVVLICLAISVLVRRRRRISNGVATFAITLSVVSLIEAARNQDLGFATFLFDAPTPGLAMWMSERAAVAGILCGLACLLLDQRVIAQVLASVAGLIGLFSLIAYGFDAHFSASADSHIALSSALMFVLIAAALIAETSDRGATALLFASDRWGRVARRMAFTSVGAPVLVGLLAVGASQAGFFDLSFAGALFVTVTTGAVTFATIRFTSRIHNSEDLYRTIVDTAQEGICMIDSRGRITFANARLMSMVGYTENELVGRIATEIVADDDRPHVLERNEIRRAGLLDASQTDLHLMHRDGTAVPVLSSTTALRGADGSTSLLSMITDMTQRTRADAAMRASEERFRSLYEANVIGVAFWTPDGVVTDANDELLRIYGVPRDVLPTWKWQASNTPEADAAEAEAMAELRERGRTSVHEKDIVRPDGTQATVVVTMARLEGDENIAFVQDVTEGVQARRALQRAHDILAERVARLEGTAAPQSQPQTNDNAPPPVAVETLAARLAEANQELETFSYSVSHDLRAPLRAVDGFSRELLSYEEQLDARGRDYLRRIRAATQRMARLIDDLLDLSRLSRKTIRREQVDVSAVATEIASEMSAARFAIEPGLTAYADPHLLRVVLENIIGNAVKFSSHRENPLVEVFRAEDGSIAVRDNGTGFDEQYMDKIFAPFQRLHGSDFEGTGIGLALVHRIILRHEGSLRAASKAGQGATFQFSFGDRR